MHTTCESRSGRLPGPREAPVSFHRSKRGLPSAAKAKRGLPGEAMSVAKAKRGQSLIEACLAMGVICLVFFGLFQVSQLAAAREVLYHAAARGARAKTVGFNRFMVSKAIHVAAIPNSGRMLEPDFTNEDFMLRDMVATMRPGELWDEVLHNTEPSSIQQAIESARIPEYMGSENWARANFILDYEDWDELGWSQPAMPPDGSILDIHVSQDYPLRIPLHRAFYAEDSVDVHGISSIESHYPLYIDDQDW